MNDEALPEITVKELRDMLAAGNDFIVLDVREPWELDLARLDDPRVFNVPLGALAQRGLEALPAPARARESGIVTLCHHGVRSLQAALWLRGLGWEKVFSLQGGIHAYAREIDRSVGRY
jgi:rhodanese-related sulfurtransferase